MHELQDESMQNILRAKESNSNAKIRKDLRKPDIYLTKNCLGKNTNELHKKKILTSKY